jgi:subtilase family serine protease
MSYNNHPNVINDYTVLNAAGIKTYEWLVQLSPGNNTIQVHADQQNNIQESNELNNRLTKRVRVIGQCSAKGALAPVKPVKVKNSLKVKNPPIEKINIKANTTPQQTAKGCAYDPNSARLPCSRKPKMKLINPFE